MRKAPFKPIFISLLLMILSLGLKAQTNLPESPRQLIPLIKKSKPDTNWVALLNKLGGYYVFKPGSFKSDLDSGMVYLNQALQLSQSLRSVKWITETLKLKGDCYIEGGDIGPGRACFKQVIKNQHTAGSFKDEADTWLRLAECLSGHPKEIDTCCTRALSLFKLLPVHDKLLEIGALKDLANAHIGERKLDLAEKELNQVLAQYKAIGYKTVQAVYDLLANLYRLKGFPNKELASALNCVNSTYASGDTSDIKYFNFKLAYTYQRFGYLDESIVYFNKALSHPVKDYGDSVFFYLIAADKAKSILRKGDAKKALETLFKDVHYTIPKDPYQKANLEQGMAACYRALKQYAKAEQYYLDVLNISKIRYKGKYTDNIGATQLTIGELYVLMKQYDKAATYLAELNAIPPQTFSAEYLARIQLLHFQLDSVRGNYFLAIQHYQNYKKLNDSVSNDTKTKQLHELEISYQTANKQRVIEGFTSREKVQRAELRRINIQWNLTLVGIILVLIIAALAYVAFRQKKRSNLSLQAHQKEIDEKNESLLQLNYKQQLLLIEKEWLLKEIHHRVKNNLQTTISLLNMQSAYLSSDEALAAIRNSQRRMQAMSLIHQKLYQSDKMTHVDMAEYVEELVRYLKESFQGSNEISFVLQIEPLMLDVAQAVPIGLIINEAVTNAIKYAFPGAGKGSIAIVFNKGMDAIYHLTIADNGVGMPPGFELDATHTSLGLSLISGLTDQINGGLVIKNNDGTTLYITFSDEGIFDETKPEGAINN